MNGSVYRLKKSRFLSILTANSNNFVAYIEAMQIRCFSLLFMLLSWTLSSHAQDTTLVTWTMTSTQKVDSLNYKVTLRGAIPSGWHIYKGDAAEDIPPPSLQTLGGDTVFQIKQIDFISSNAMNTDDPLFGKNQTVFKDSIRLQFHLLFTSPPASLQTKLSYYIAKGDFLNQEEPLIALSLSEQSGQVETPLQRIKIPSIDLNNPVIDYGASPKLAKKAFGASFFLGLWQGCWHCLHLACFR